MQEKQNIIFDFDGTIADTMPFIFTVANELAREFGFDPVSEDQFEEFKSKSPFEIVQDLHIPLWKIPFILHKGRQLLKKHMRNAPYVPGMKQVLIELKERGYKIGMLTSNAQENIDIFLRKNDLRVFDFVNTENNLFGKQFSLRNILKKQRLNKDKTVYVGDEVRDIEACQVVQLDIISVTWGFNSKKLLRKYNPTYIADTPQDLLKILQKNV